MPAGANIAGVGYAYTAGDISLDPELRIEDGQFDVHTIAAKYVHSFALFGQSARVELAQPYQIGNWSGLLSGVQTATDRSGLADIHSFLIFAQIML